METIAFLNRKGGVGKSTTCHHVAGALSALGLKVLLADMDPQASLTRGWFGDLWTDALPPAQAVVAAFDPRGRPLPSVARPVPPPHERIEILPGSVELRRANIPLPEGEPTPEELRLFAEFLADARGVDLCLVDCPPNLDGCAWAALAAATAIVVPLIPEDYGAMGIVAVLRFVERVRAEANPGLRVLGLLLNKLKRARLHGRFRDAIRAEYGGLVFAAEVGDRVALAESLTGRTTIDRYAPRSEAAAEVARVADELLARLALEAAPAAGKGVA